MGNKRWIRWLYDAQTADGVYYTANLQVKLQKVGGNWKVESFTKQARNAWC